MKVGKNKEEIWCLADKRGPSLAALGDQDIDRQDTEYGQRLQDGKTGYPGCC